MKSETLAEKKIGTPINKSERRIRIRTDQLLEHIGTWLLAIVLALIVWLIAITEEDPLQRGEFSVEIPVESVGLAAGLQPLEEIDSKTVRPILQAPRSSWRELDVNDFTAYVDLSGLGTGTQEVPVQVTISDPSVKVLNPDELSITVQLDTVLTKTVPVHVEVADSAAFGYEWQPPIYEPVTVTVRGPEAFVEQVAVAEATVYLRNAKSQVERVQALTPQNDRGQFVSGLDLEPNLVRIVVPVNRWPDRKEVAIRPNWEGQPAAGYRLGAIEVEPSTVILLGDNNLLNQIPGFVETEPLLLEGATEEIREQLKLVLPEGVTALGGDTVSIRTSIVPIEGGATLQRKPQLENLGDNLKASVALETVDVILRGPLTQLEDLNEDDVNVILDLQGLLPGSHIIRPRVQMPEEISLEGVLPETVEVVITSLIPPTVVSPLATPIATRERAILPPTPTYTPTPAPE